MAAAVAYRSSGRFCSDFMTTASTATGTSGFSVDGGDGVSRTCWYATDTGLSPTNGGRPVSSS